MGTAAAAAAADFVFELEAKRKDDSSWHPCQVSRTLSSDTSTSLGLTVDFGSQNCEEVIYTKEDALARLRIRSIPIQDDECSQIKEGEHVLASQESQFGTLFFDAEVEKVCRVRHSKRNQCRCTFVIKWLYPHRQAVTATVPASSIMKLSAYTVDSHPMVGEFLDSVNTINFSGVSSFVSLFDETVFEDLEKQIEEISRFADVSRKEFPEARPFELKKDAVDLTGQVRHRTIESQVSFQHDQVASNENNSRRTTRSRKKTQVEAPKPPSPPQLVTEESDRLYLSPLGARAALASLIYKSPTDAKLSPYNSESEGFSKAPHSTPVNHTTIISFNVTSTLMDNDINIHEKVSVKDGLVSNVGACRPPVALMHGEVLSSDRDASNKFLRTKVIENRSPSDGKLKSSLKTTRFTRSAIQKGIGVSDEEVGPESCSEETKVKIHMKATRLTRLAIQKENGLSDKEVDVFSVPNQTPRFTRSSTQKGGNVALEVKKGLQELANSSLLLGTKQKEIRHSNKESEAKSYEEMKLLNSLTPRITRSGKHKNTCSDSTRELVIPQTRETRRKKPLSSPSDDETNLPLVQEKKQRVSGDARVARNEGEIPESGVKNLRSSPRLTRSQKKSS